MKIFISKQLNKYLAEGFPRLDADHGKHVLPEPDAMRDFKKQSSWVGKNGEKRQSLSKQKGTVVWTY